MDRTELEMKKVFVSKISNAITEAKDYITKIEYVIIPEGSNYYTEYAVVSYRGGSIQARDCTANSITAILEEIVRMMYSSQIYPADTARYKEAISNNPIEIRCSTETFYDVVYMYDSDNEEYIDEYDNRDDAIAAYNSIMQEIEEGENSYNYVVLRKIEVDHYDDGTEEELIDIIESYSKD